MVLCDAKMLEKLEGEPLRYLCSLPSSFERTCKTFHPILIVPATFRHQENQEPVAYFNIADSKNGTRTIEIPQCRWKSCNAGNFESLDRLAAHVSLEHALSGPDGLFYCGWQDCDRASRGFNARYKMLVHVRTHTNEKPHQCRECTKCFSRAENLKIHVRSHSGERPYICPVIGCGKAYSNSSDRFKHTRTHQVEKPYHCKVEGCTKKYTDPSSLRKHTKTHKNDVNRLCDSIIVASGCGSIHSKNDSISTRSNFVQSCLQQKWNHIIKNYSENTEYVFNSLEDTPLQLDLPLDLSINRSNL